MPVYKNHQVAALAWAIESPNLLTNVAGLPGHTDIYFRQEYNAATNWLAELDDDPSQLLAALNKPGHWRVGLYFERLISFWLEHHPSYRLACHELQIRTEERTLGALDFVVENQTGDYEHWEVAVKFYLQADASSSWSAWIGPNKRDRLDLKTSRMITHQLPLSTRPEAQERLRNHSVPSIAARRGILKGLLFKPFGPQTPECEFANPNLRTGLWVEARHLNKLTSKHTRQRWFQRTKPDWLGERLVAYSDTVSRDELLAHFKKAPAERPTMWSLVETTEGGWITTKRFFIVQDDWITPAEKNARLK